MCDNWLIFLNQIYYVFTVLSVYFTLSLQTLFFSSNPLEQQGCLRELKKEFAELFHSAA